MMRNMITRRRFLGETAALAGGLTVAALIGAGCTPKVTSVPEQIRKGEPTAPKETSMKAEERLTLRIQIMSGAQGAYFGELLEGFMQINPNITTRIEELPWGDIRMKTEMGYATGDLPDALFSHTSWHWLGCYKGFYRAIDDLLDAGFVPDYDDFYEVAVENQKFEGKTYGLLESAVVSPGAYITWNRELFADAGVEPPSLDTDIWGLHELAMRAAKPGEGVFGIQALVGGAAVLETLTRVWGKPEYGPTGDTSTWLTSVDGKQFNFLENVGAQEVFQTWYKSLVDARVQPKKEDQAQLGYTTPDDLFIAGKLAIFQCHQGYPQRFRYSIGDNWDYHPQDTLYLPSGPDGRVGSCWHTHVRCVSGMTKHVEEAMRLSAYLNTYEAQMVALAATGNRSARKSVYRDPKWQEDFPHYRFHDEVLSTGRVEPFCMPWNVRVDEFLDTLGQMLSPLVDGKRSWNEYAPTIQKEVQRIFDLPRP